MPSPCYNEMKDKSSFPTRCIHVWKPVFHVSQDKTLLRDALFRCQIKLHLHIPLRELFHELMQSCKRGENPVQPDTVLLNTALKAFMSQRDYAGAIIVVGTFGLFQVPLDNKSYYCVVKLLVRRVWSEVQACRPKHQERWVDRFLGVQHYSDIVLSRSLVHEIFTCSAGKILICRCHFTHPSERGIIVVCASLRQRPGEEAYYTFPTMEMMESLVLPVEPLKTSSMIGCAFDQAMIVSRIIRRCSCAMCVDRRESGLLTRVDG
jgi:hypothetical protein